MHQLASQREGRAGKVPPVEIWDWKARLSRDAKDMNGKPRRTQQQNRGSGLSRTVPQGH